MTIWQRVQIVGAVVALGVGLAPYANAAHATHAVCGDREKMVEYLASEYDQALVYEGVTGAGTVVQVLASPDGVWSLLMVFPTHGIACFMGAGKQWRVLRPGIDA